MWKMLGPSCLGCLQTEGVLKKVCRGLIARCAWVCECERALEPCAACRC